MRKLWRLRRIFIPQAVALIAVFTAVICSPLMGVSCAAANTAGPGGTMITVTQEGDETVSAATSSMILSGQTDEGEETNEAAVNTAVYDNSVLRALTKMGLTAKHLELWAGEHPRTTLKGLNSMTTARQRQVANIATFIRKVNRTISPKIAWREACAFVYYSGKYGVPTNLAVGIAKTESRFNPGAVSRSGALGVMQVMWKVHYGMLGKKGIAAKRDHMFDPERGVEAGLLILSRYMNVYGSMQKALNRYYGGIAHSYVKKINKNMAMLESHSSATGF